MWIRVLKAGYTIVVLPEQLTAFRIRDGKKNMSARRDDSILRHHFELVQILRQYVGMEPRLIREIFTLERARAGLEESVGTELLLAEMAMSVGSPAYDLFALQVLYDFAENVDDFKRLSTLTGQLDIFGLLKHKAAKKSHRFFKKFHGNR